jgi:hypothetical protein
MKRGPVVAVMVLCVARAAAAAPQHEFGLAGFDIAVTRTAKGVSLVCKAGCSWKTLDFTPGTKPTPVNEDGMADDKPTEPGKAGTFLIRFGINDDGFQLSCDRGCAWRTLGWTLPEKGAPTRINEYGMVPSRK